MDDRQQAELNTERQHAEEYCMPINEYLTLAFKEIKEINAKIAELDKEKKVITDHVKDLIGTKQAVIDSNGVEIATYRYSVRNSIDADRLLKENADIYFKYMKQKEIRTLLIKGE